MEILTYQASLSFRVGHQTIKFGHLVDITDDRSRFRLQQDGGEWRTWHVDLQTALDNGQLVPVPATPAEPLKPLTAAKKADKVVAALLAKPDLAQDVLTRLALVLGTPSPLDCPACNGGGFRGGITSPACPACNGTGNVP